MPLCHNTNIHTYLPLHTKLSLSWTVKEAMQERFAKAARKETVQQQRNAQILRQAARRAEEQHADVGVIVVCGHKRLRVTVKQPPRLTFRRLFDRATEELLARLRLESKHVEQLALSAEFTCLHEDPFQPTNAVFTLQDDGDQIVEGATYLLTAGQGAFSCNTLRHDGKRMQNNLPFFCCACICVMLSVVRLQLCAAQSCAICCTMWRSILYFPVT